jgi:hypothetical protein
VGPLLRAGETMNDPMRAVEIDRIRLIGLEVTPERAKRIQGLVEVELQRLLGGERWADGLAGGEVSRLDASTMHVDRPHSDKHLANDLAQSIAQALRGAGDREKEEKSNARI